MNKYNALKSILSNIKQKMSKLNGYEILYHKYGHNQYYYDIKSTIMELKRNINVLNEITQHKYKFNLEYKRHNDYSDIALWYKPENSKTHEILYLYC